MSTVFVNNINRFLDDVLWIELKDADTGETRIISGRELDAFKQKRAGEAEEQANNEEIHE